MVRVPPGEWLVADSLRQRQGGGETIPAVSLLEAHQAEASVVALTHPHLDHADGLPSILDRRGPSGAVGCLAAHFEPPERWRGNPDSEIELSGSATEAALQRVFDIWEREPQTRWDLTTDQTRALGDGSVRVVHPPEGRAAALARGTDPNRASSPLVIEWEGAELLLGADLPTTEWKRVPQTYARSGSLAGTGALKVSHHGSIKAQHEIAIGYAPPSSRVCVATPWTKGARGHRLPRFEVDHGVDVLLAVATELQLSSMPTPYDLGRGRRLTRAEAEQSTLRRRIGGDLVLDVEPSPPDAMDAWVHVALDRDGNIAAIQLGEAAVTVVAQT